MFRKIASKELIAWNQKGWIPGPAEDEEAFLARIQKLDHFFSSPPTNVDDFLTDIDWEGARRITQRLYGFAPDWIVAHYSNENLPFYQGGAAWLFEEKGIKIPLIQLKKRFERGSLYKIYRKEEVLAHEAVHAVRMGFESPKFEEIFAYKTSPSFFRKWLGPIFQTSWESILFLLLLAIPLSAQIAFYFVQPFKGWWILFLIPWFYLFLLGIRLGLLHLQLHRCLKNLKRLVGNQALPFAFRLTDEEILAFAKIDSIEDYIKEQHSLRWRMLKARFL